MRDGITDSVASPASNGGRGLKPDGITKTSREGKGIARQQWRARIETSLLASRSAPHRRIARQQWRARIETG